jgi:hypothetical protein
MINKAYSIVSNNSLLPEKRVIEMSYFLGDKGYGDNKQELQFIASFFKTIFQNHNELESFEWSQYQDWDDQGLYFDLQSYIINDKLTIGESFMGFEDAPSYTFNPEINLNYGFSSKEHDDIEFPDTESGWEKYAEFFDNFQEQLAPTKVVVDYVLIFLKSLYEHHRPYYFIYLFGRRARVKITRLGVEITHNDIDYSDGDSYDSDYKIS